MVAAAKKYPDVKFEQATGLQDRPRTWPSTTAPGEDAIYLSGMAAGAATKKGVDRLRRPVRDPRGHPARERVRARRAGDAPGRQDQARVDEVVARRRQGEEGRREPAHLGRRRRDRAERRLACRRASTRRAVGIPWVGYDSDAQVVRAQVVAHGRGLQLGPVLPQAGQGRDGGTWKTGSYWGGFKDKFIDARALRRRRLGQDQGRHRREDGRDQEGLVLRVPGPDLRPGGQAARAQGQEAEPRATSSRWTGSSRASSAPPRADRPPVSDPRSVTAVPAVTLRGVTKRFPGVRRERRRRPRDPRRRGARAAGRERRGQEHALEHRHGPLPAGRGLARAARRARRRCARRAMPWSAASGWCTSTSVSSSRSPSPRTSRSATSATGGSCPTAPRSSASVAALADQFGLAVDPRARIWQLSVGEQQRVEILKALLPRRAHPDPRRADRGADAAGGARALRDAARDGGRRPRDRLHLAQAARGAGGLRPHHRAARRARRRDGRDRERDAGGPRGADGRPRGRDGAAAAERASRSARSCWRRYDLHAEGDRGLPALRGVSLAVRGGEIVGVAGVAGNGQRELAEALDGHARR